MSFSPPFVFMCFSCLPRSLSLSLFGPTWFPAVVSLLWSPSPSLSPSKLRRAMARPTCLSVRVQFLFLCSQGKNFSRNFLGKSPCHSRHPFVFMCFSCLPRSVSLSLFLDQPGFQQLSPNSSPPSILIAREPNNRRANRWPLIGTNWEIETPLTD